MVRMLTLINLETRTISSARCFPRFSDHVQGYIEAILPILEGELLTRTRSVAIVGHEPHLGDLLGSLLTGRANISIPLTKGMLVGVETDSASNVICNLRFSITQQIAANIS